MKPVLKDILNVTITDSKKLVKTLTDKQLEALSEKIERLSVIINSEKENRNEVQ